MINLTKVADVQLAERVTERKLLALVGRMLKAKVVMPNGVRVSNEEGVPQGGPLSPLLSNIVLDELDQELGAVTGSFDMRTTHRRPLEHQGRAEGDGERDPIHRSSE